MKILIFLSYIFGFTGAIPTRDFTFDTSNFAAIVARPTFVDKTLLIKQFLKATGQILITVPHRFGKSTNMNMIRRFLEVVVHEKGTKTENCKIFQTNNLKISQDQEFFNKHCGQYPVIYVDFKLLGGSNLETVLNRFRRVLHDIFRQHCYLMSNTSPDVVSRFKLYVNNYKLLNETEVTLGLNVLSELLHDHFKKQVSMLIDDYDLPIFNVIFDSEEERKKTDIFFRYLMLQILKNNNFLERVLIHASPRPTNLLFVGYNSINHYPFLENHAFAEFYGFTETEVNMLAGKFNMTSRIDEIKRACNEYELKERNLKIYSAWLVVQFMKYGGFKRYFNEDDALNLVQNATRILQ